MRSMVLQLFVLFIIKPAATRVRLPQFLREFRNTRSQRRLQLTRAVIVHGFHNGQFSVNGAVSLSLLFFVIDVLFTLLYILVKFRSADTPRQASTKERLEMFLPSTFHPKIGFRFAVLHVAQIRFRESIDLHAGLRL